MRTRDTGHCRDKSQSTGSSFPVPIFPPSVEETTVYAGLPNHDSAYNDNRGPRGPLDTCTPNRDCGRYSVTRTTPHRRGGSRGWTRKGPSLDGPEEVLDDQSVLPFPGEYPFLFPIVFGD